MKKISDIPAEFWRVLCEDVDHPIAATTLDHKFIWCNGAYELLVGYSLAELLGRSWLSITDQHDVGGDLASAQALIDGQSTKYTLSKNYLHKRGHPVPVDITVRRFPVQATTDIGCFRIEAQPARVSRDELEDVRQQLANAIAEVKRDVRSNTDRIEVNVGDNWRDGDKSGRDKTQNSTKAVQYLAAALVVLAGVLMWGMYYVATIANHTQPNQPPAPGVGITAPAAP